MTLTRFRSVADMPDPPALRSPLESVAAACALSEMSRAFGHEPVSHRGVRKFRSVAEASDDREAREDAAVRDRAAKRRAQR